MLVYLTDGSAQFYVLPHWDRRCRSNFLPHPVTVYWHRVDQSQRWPYNARRLAGQPLECQFSSHWYNLILKKFQHKPDSNPRSSTLEADVLTTRPTRRCKQCRHHCCSTTGHDRGAEITINQSITMLITWRKEECRKEAAHMLSSKVEMICVQSHKLWYCFQGNCGGDFWETGWSADWLFWVQRCCFEGVGGWGGRGTDTKID